MSKGRMQSGSCTAGMRREEVEALIRAANLSWGCLSVGKHIHSVCGS